MFTSSGKGQGLIEYALVICVVVILVVVAFCLLIPDIKRILDGLKSIGLS